MGSGLRGGAQRVSMCSSSVSFCARVSQMLRVCCFKTILSSLFRVNLLFEIRGRQPGLFFSFSLQPVQRTRRLKPGPTEVRDCCSTLALILHLLPFSAFVLVPFFLNHPWSPQVCSSYCPFTMQKCCSVSFKMLF